MDIKRELAQTTMNFSLADDWHSKLCIGRISLIFIASSLKQVKCIHMICLLYIVFSQYSFVIADTHIIQCRFLLQQSYGKNTLILHLLYCFKKPSAQIFTCEHSYSLVYNGMMKTLYFLRNTLFNWYIYFRISKY